MPKKAELVPVKTRVPRSTLRTLKGQAKREFRSVMAVTRDVLIQHARLEDWLEADPANRQLWEKTLAELQPTKPQKTKRK